MSISQRNSVAPMALNAEFKDHQKTSYPFKQTAPKPKYHHIILRSTDKISGTNNSAVFNMDGLPDLEGDAFLLVDTLLVSNTDESAVSSNVWTCHIKELTQTSGYLTNGKMSDVVAVSRGYGFTTLLTTQDGLGIPINTKALNSQKNWTVYFTFYDPSKIMTGNWLLSLTIYEKGNSVFE